NRGFANPKIFKDGSVCTDCYNFTSLAANTVIFNVTGFSNYTISDTPDIFAPLISILSPSSNYYKNNSIYFDLSSNENLSGCLFSLNNGSNYLMALNLTKLEANYT